MTSTEILLVLNSAFLGIISLLFLVIGYFLKNLHKDFKNMVDKVNKVHGELYTHLVLFENLTKLFQRQIDVLKDRIKAIEKELTKKK